MKIVRDHCIIKGVKNQYRRVQKMQKEKLLKEVRALLELCDERGLKLVKQLILGILQKRK